MSNTPKLELQLRNAEAFEAVGDFVNEALAAFDGTANEARRAYIQAVAIQQLKTALTDEMMRPIMALQGSPLGFKTDKDRDGGYDVETVRNCAIVAFLQGIRLTGNELNIIGANPYIAVNGCERLLAQMSATPPVHSNKVPIFDEPNRKATVEYSISYDLKSGIKGTKTMTVPVKLQFIKNTSICVTSDEAVIGKARRKVIWAILREVKGVSIRSADDDVIDITPQAQGASTPARTQAPARVSMLEAVGGAGEPAKETVKAEPTTPPPIVTTPAAKAPAQETKSEVLPMDRDGIIEAIKGALLDHEVPEARLLDYAIKTKLKPEDVDELFALPTEALAKLAPAIPALSRKPKA